MKRIMLLLVIGILFAACSPETAPESEASIPDAPARAETAVSEEPASELESESNTQSLAEIEIPNFPATTVQEASVVRERDWKLGAEDPLVTIIEYGDFQ